MAGTVPIRFAELCSLTNLGISTASFRFGFLTMESDKYICVRDTAADGTNQVAIIDCPNGFNVTRRPMKAEAAIMNPVANILALKAKDETEKWVLQIFNLDTKSKLKMHTSNEAIVFWRWLSPNKLALVTQSSVFHWSMEGTDAPVKVFDRAGNLADQNTQIISYSVDHAEKWCLLTGISTPDGGQTINGHIQLYSIEKRQQQLLEGHAAAFGKMVVEDGQPAASLYAFAERKAPAPGAGISPSRLHIMDIGKARVEGQTPPFKRTVDIPYPPEAPNDFPISMQFDEKHGVLYMITKMGFLFIWEVSTASLIFRNRISAETIFITCKNSANDGIIGVNKKGQVLSIAIDENNLIPYIQKLTSIPNNGEVAIKLASRFGLAGADELFVTQFNQYFAMGDYKNASRIAAEAPGASLRNSDTINKFKQLPAQAGAPPPILQYFSTLLEKGKLNRVESIELARPVLAQGRRELLEKWLKEDKLECSEELGDVVKTVDVILAQSVYLRAAAHTKVINCMVEQGQYDKIVLYAKRVGFSPDWTFLVRNIVLVNPEGAYNMAKMLVNNPDGGALVDVNAVVDIFMQHNRLQECTRFLLEYLAPNRKEDAVLQTRLLEMNLMTMPQVADAILQAGTLTNFDRARIATLCEKAGLFQRALELYTELADIKRVMLNTHAIAPEFLVNFFGTQTPDNALACLNDLLKANRANLQLVVQAAIKYNEQITSASLIKLFETYNSFEGLFYYLGAVIATSQDPDVHFKYIEAAAKLGHFKEVERVARDSKVYDAVKVKDFLKDAKLPDPRPLIYVCDQHGYVDELTQYLYKLNLNKYIEVYVSKVNPSQTPLVVGTLLDLDASEDFVKSLLNLVRGACPVEPLVEEVEKRNRLRLIQLFLEARAGEGNVEPSLHNALAKIYIDTNRDPEKFLIENQFYDSKVVGKYCEERDPHLAFTAYKRAWGQCDIELVEVCNKNGLFRLEARYLVERQNQDLWGVVLQQDNEYRRQVIDQVVATALPETKDPDEVSSTVKAFMTADLPNELIELLEKIVLHNSDFSSNKNLQNLLILTAIKADKGRVMDYINRLDNFDGPDIAKIALGEQYKLYEEAFVIYKKNKLHVDAVDVLLDHIGSIDRAFEFAERVNEADVWSHLAKAQLLHNLVPQAIESFIKAQDASMYSDVIMAAEREGFFTELVKYLRMARTKAKDAHIDTELVYSLAKTGAQSELEEFISGPNTANVQAIGDRCFDQGLYEPAKLLYTSIGNNAKLASTLVKLQQYQAAVDAARKANSPRVWKEVNAACVAAKEFRLAQIAGLHIIIIPDHLEELISHYENLGYFEELISLLESGLGLERAHSGMFTELGILYAKYKPEKLMEHCKAYHQRLNIPKLLRACERHMHWSEVVYLYIHYNEFDNAINTMIQHSSVAFNHDEFLRTIQKVSNMDLHYKSINFYLQEQPMLLNELLRTLTQKLDHAKVVHTIRKAGHLPLILPFLKTVQNANILAVNEAINELYVEQEEYDSLRQSITDFDNFDQVALAQKTEKHELLEFRRIAAFLYKRNKRFQQSIELSKQDKLFKDAMETAHDSRSQELAEELLKFFVEKDDKECFAACLYTCYDLVRPDTALELAWRNNIIDFVMPYLIQVLREYTSRLDSLEKKHDKKDKEDKAKEEAAASAPAEFHDMGYYQPPGMGNLALMPPPGSMPNMPVYGAPPMGMGASPMGFGAPGYGAPGFGGY